MVKHKTPRGIEYEVPERSNFMAMGVAERTAPWDITALGHAIARLEQLHERTEGECEAKQARLVELAQLLDEERERRLAAETLVDVVDASLTTLMHESDRVRPLLLAGYRLASIEGDESAFTAALKDLRLIAEDWRNGGAINGAINEAASG